MFFGYCLANIQRKDIPKSPVVMMIYYPNRSVIRLCEIEVYRMKSLMKKAVATVKDNAR